MLGFIKEIIIQYCDLIVMEKKKSISEVTKLSYVLEGYRYHCQKAAHLLVLSVVLQRQAFAVSEV